MTRKPGLLQSMGSQRVGHDLATEYMSLLSLPHPVLQEIMVENVLRALVLATKLKQRE